MKKLLLSIVLFLVAMIAIEGQTPDNSAAGLNQRVIKLASEGNLDSAIPLAKQVVEMQRRLGAPPRHVATALENLAQLYISRFFVKERPLDQRSEDGKAAEENLTEALQLSGRDAATPIEQKVAIRNGLAMHLDRFRPTVNAGRSGFERDSRERYSSILRANFRERTELARKLFQESIRISSEAGDAGLASLALSLYQQGELELANSELESAISLFEQSIDIVRKIKGAKSKELLLPLSSYAKVLAATGQDEKAMDAISQIVRISGETTKFPKELPNLTYRSSRPFGIETSAAVDAGSRAARNAVELRTRHSVMLSGNPQGAGLATSTQKFEYFQGSNNVRMWPYFVRVLVDPTGKVTEADCFSCDEPNKIKMEKIVGDWTFRPFVQNGSAFAMNGYVTVTVITDLLKP